MIIAGLWFSYLYIYGNFHKIDKDLYRSAQLNTYNMPYYIQKNQIKSILNLRKDIHKQWYINELRISKELNVTHYDFGISDRGSISVEQMDKIVKIMEDAPKPLLIHCKAGSDRTSLAAALYLYAIKHEKNPQRAISIIYGHFPWLGSRTVAMDKSFELYKKNKESNLTK